MIAEQSAVRLRFVDKTGLVSLRDGRVLAKDLPRGLTLYDEKNVPEAVRDSFRSFTSEEEGFSDTLYVVAEAGLQKGPPLRIMLERTRETFRGRIAIYLAKEAQAEIRALAIDEAKTLVDDTWDFFLAEGSSLVFSTLSAYEEESMARTRRRAHVHENATLSLDTGALGDENAHQENRFFLKGRKARARSRSVVLSAKRQETVVKTLMAHEAPATESLIEHYGVAADESFLAFEAATRIEKGMKKSSARQKNHGVILGEKARLDANPLLYIDEYDVEAAHGAAIGRIDEEELYYLMSRGLTERDAQMLIIQGFLAPLDKLVEETDIERAVRGLVTEKIGR